MSLDLSRRRDAGGVHDRRRGDEPSCDLRGYLLLANGGALAAAVGVPRVQAIPWTVLAVFVVGAADAVWLRVRDTPQYQTLGRVAVDEA